MARSSTTVDRDGRAGQDGGSPVDRHRDRSLEAKGRADAAQAQADQRRATLTAHEERLKQMRRVVKDTQRQLRQHKSAVKRLESQRRDVEDAWKSARKNAGKADRKARKAEAKYDDAILRQMVAREKDVDISLSRDAPPEGGELVVAGSQSLVPSTDALPAVPGKRNGGSGRAGGRRSRSRRVTPPDI